MKKIRFGVVLVVAVLGLMAAPVFADNLFVCQSCTTAPSAPTLITDLSMFNVGIAGNHATVSPLLIIVGTYNGAPAPTLSFGANTFSPGGTAIYGWNGSSTAVTFNGSSGSAYDALGISPEQGGSSETFSNWNSSPEGLAGHGIPPATSFSLFVYELTNVTIPAMGAVTLDMTGATVGSFVIGYACEQAVSPCPAGSSVGSTPFTTAGIVDTTAVPEPSSLALLGGGLLALGGIVRRRIAKS